MAEDPTFELPDGRKLGYTTYGAELTPGKPVLFYFHGSPGTHSEGAPVHDAASKCGAVLVGVTRPGFGDSTAQPDRTLSSFASDVLHLADHLGVQQFAVLGISGGGPYALACLRALPADRLRAVAVVSGMWPLAFGTAGMATHLRAYHNLNRWIPGTVGWLLGLGISSAADLKNGEARSDEMIAGGFKSWPEVDREAIFGNGGKLFKALARSTRECVKHGSAGVGCEGGLFARPWDFALEDVPVDGRLALWHGGKDVNVPIGMADKAVEVLKNVEYHRYEDEGHLSVALNHLDEILDMLLGKLGE
ncbi:uncharacterized protein E0L32_011286 [Thyridium curvatum]|uniref:AB hydrolase-1 domain-containing protein n=1 Tax=Thyridium curvatum TaxID=1093900 RepID=A0A507B9N4_9PEZI|nr:uncharacterized protein E0L32_011286 [Thyridium curvatum]TPX19042.1 hypothetical protein E0L32_011286 [Thyridium curvatum]